MFDMNKYILYNDEEIPYIYYRVTKTHRVFVLSMKEGNYSSSFRISALVGKRDCEKLNNITFDWDITKPFTYLFDKLKYV